MSGSPSLRGWRCATEPVPDEGTRALRQPACRIDQLAALRPPRASPAAAHRDRVCRLGAAAPVQPRPRGCAASGSHSPGCRGECCGCAPHREPRVRARVSGTIKNALDWLVGCEAFIDKPVAVLNTSARAHVANAALRETLRTMSARVIGEASVTLALLGAGLDEDGMVGSPEVAAALRGVLAAIHEAVGAAGAPAPTFSLRKTDPAQRSWINPQGSSSLCVAARCRRSNIRRRRSWKYNRASATSRPGEILGRDDPG